MAVSFTQGNDFIVPTEDGQTYLGGAGNDTYMLSDATIAANSTIVIQDTEGTNKIQLVGGLSIESSLVTSNALQLTLSNGAVVQILGADTFGYDVGGNALAGTSGTDQDFTELVETTLGITVPAAGEDPATGGEVTITEGGTSTPGDFTLTNDATSGSLNEGTSATFTITAAEAVTADTTFSYTLGGSGSNPAGAADFTSSTSGSVVIAAGAESATFTVSVAAADGAEFAEGFTVLVKDSAGATVGSNDLIINDTNNDDLTAPIVTDPGTSLNYDENQTAGTTIGTVAATDAVGVTGFAIVSGDTAGNFAIDASGNISLTDAGVASSANDFETTANTVTLGITATDAAGNTSAVQDITLEVKDVDDVPPALTAATLSGSQATLTFDEALGSATPLASDFAVSVKGASAAVSINKVTVSGSTVLLDLAAAPAAGETFQVTYTPGATPLEDVLGNDALAISATDIVLDTTAPVITAAQIFTYQEGQHDDIADVVGKVLTDDASAGTFVIESGDADNFFDIDGSGNITLTTAGLVASAASNDFETGANSFTLGISATDGAGNKSATQTVTVNVTDNAADNLEAPIIANLTVGADPGTGVVLGSNNDDTISGTVSANAGETTLSAIDFINAGDHGAVGDTLNIELKGAGGVAGSYNGGATIQNVENLKLTTVGVASTFNANGVTSFTNVTNNSSSVALTVTNLLNTMLDIDVNNIAAGTSAGTFNWSASQLTGTEALTVALDSVGTGGTSALTVGPATAVASSFGSIDITSNGNNANSLTLTTDGTQTSIASLDLNGSQALTLALAADNIATTATTIDATDMTNSLALSGLGAAVHNVTGGSGSDLINFSTVGSFTVADTVNGGTAGTDTLGADGAAITAITTTNKAALISNIETIFINNDGGAAAVTADLSFFGSGASNVRIANQVGAAGTDVITVNNLQNGGNVRFDGDALAANVLNVTNATNAGTDDTMTIDLRGNGASLIDSVVFTMNGVENLNIDTTNATAAKSTNITDAALETVVVTGIQSLDMTTGNTVTLGASVKSVDASAMTGAAALTVTLNAAANVGAQVTGTGNADTIIGSSQADDIIGGAGVDTITGLAGADKIAGGAGNDNFRYTTGSGAGTTDSGATIASGGSTLALDIISDASAGDTIVFTGYTTAPGAAALDTMSSAIGSAIGGAENTVNFIKGTYDSNAQIWTSSAAGTDTLMVYDADDAAASNDYDAVVLVGFVDSGASALALAGGATVLTLG